jgi:hypothetical protein
MYSYILVVPFRYNVTRVISVHKQYSRDLNLSVYQLSINQINKTNTSTNVTTRLTVDCIISIYKGYITAYDPKLGTDCIGRYKTYYYTITTTTAPPLQVGKPLHFKTWYGHFQRNGGLNQIFRHQTSRFHYGSKIPAVTITASITILEQNR